jgi:4-hydroxy-tetrahydrodipicolinate synthase
MNQVVKGIVGACLTPFTADNRVDGPTFQKLVDFLIRYGVDAIGGPMHSGESLNLSVEERRELAKLAVEAAGGRVPVLVHTSFPGTDEVVSLSRYAQTIGAQGVIVITPYYWKPSQEALFDHYVTVASSLDISVVAYNSPQLGVSLTPGLLKMLIERCPNFIGFKDASFDMGYFTEACMVASEAGRGFSVFTGIEYLLTSMPVGGSGAFSAFLAPRLVKSLYDACAAGDYERARPLQYKVCRLRTIIKDGAPSMKAAMEIMGRPIGQPRKPLQKIDSAGFKRMQSEIESLGILSEEPYGWQ